MNEMRKLMEALDKISNEKSPFKVILTDWYDAVPDDDEYYEMGPSFDFDVYYKDTKIGSMVTGAWGGWKGTLGNRQVELEDDWDEIPDSRYYYVEGPKNKEILQRWENYFTYLIIKYFTTHNTGRKHLELIKRKMELK